MSSEKVLLSKNERILKWAIIFAYLFVLALACVDFKNTTPGDEMGVILLYTYFLLPVFTLIISIYIGKDKNLNKIKLVFILVFGLLYGAPLIGWYGIIGLFKLHPLIIVNGMIVSALGLLIGVLIEKDYIKKLKKSIKQK